MSKLGIKIYSGSFIERAATTITDDGKYGRIKTTTAEDFYATGSFMGSRAFIVQSAGNTVITPGVGDSVAASNFTAKTTYDIGVKRVSGSGVVHILY